MIYRLRYRCKGEEQMNCEDMVKIPELKGVLNLKAGAEGMLHPIRWIYFADCLQCVKNEYRVEELYTWQ